MADSRFPISQDSLINQDSFGGREVGVTHPDTAAHIRLLDNGDIQLIASDGLGMVFHVANKSITIIANQVKFITSDTQGLRWNNIWFNNKAIVFNEPAYHPVVASDTITMYTAAHNYFPSSGSG